MELDVHGIKRGFGLTDNSNFIYESKTFLLIKKVIKGGALPRKTNVKVLLS